ncbi:hypothetical protein CBD41_07560 [bacterium TMED181]|nr:hypothetical protein [Planctomycetota bacterium]OUW43216.1 MAG: hypothetical protein CBD41_07560 [bacterium TMED181]
MRGWRVIRDQISEWGRGIRRLLGHPDLRSLKGERDCLRRDLRSVLGKTYSDLKGVGRSTAPDSGAAQPLEDYEAGCHSQNGEDGCLLEILSRIGSTRGVVVEIGCGAAVESNSALLISEFGWQGILIDADGQQIMKAKEFYRAENVLDSVQLNQCMVSPENADGLISEMLLGRDVNVISIDVDGWDFWIWNALASYRPAVFVIEVNASFGSEASVTIPYSYSALGHDPYHHEFRGWHHGASVSAMVALGKRLGYSLVHIESSGTNAFFVHNEAMNSSLKEIEPQQAWRPHQFRSRRHSPEKQEEILSGTPVIKISENGVPES